MFKFTPKKGLFLVMGFLIVGAIIYILSNAHLQKRKVASTEEGGEASHLLDSISLNWQETENGLIFNVSDNDGSLCKKWSSLDIVFRAEGLAYSGEVDRVVQTASCEEGHFQQTWVPNLTQVESENYQKMGVFAEEPPQWVMEQIILDGAGGTQVLSAEEIRLQYGRIPAMTPK